MLFLIENVSVPPDPRVWPEARALRDAGFHVTIISPQGTPPYDGLHEQREEISIHRYPGAPRWFTRAGYAGEYAWALWQTFRLVRRLQKDTAFDVVHVGNPPDLLVLAALPVRRAGGVVVFDHHDLVPELFRVRFGSRSPLHRITLLAERLAFTLSDIAIAPNESYRDIAVSRGGKSTDNVFIVRNGPDTKSFVPCDPDFSWKRGKRHLITYVGIMGPQDGVDHALRALTLLRDRDDWHALFVGTGSFLPQAVAFVRESGLDDRVEFTGFLPRDDVISIISASDVCLSPEPCNPFNDASTMVKIPEYMAVGRPTVAYDLRESRVSAGAAAIYAEPNNVRNFADCIRRLLDEPGLGESLGREGRRRVEESLCWERSRRDLLRAYDRVTDLMELRGLARRGAGA